MAELPPLSRAYLAVARHLDGRSGRLHWLKLRLLDLALSRHPRVLSLEPAMRREVYYAFQREHDADPVAVAAMALAISGLLNMLAGLVVVIVLTLTQWFLGPRSTPHDIVACALIGVAIVTFGMHLAAYRALQCFGPIEDQRDRLRAFDERWDVLVSEAQARSRPSPS